MKRKMMDRLSNLPDSVLTHILSLLQNMKQVVRSSVLSRRWRFLWKSVPLSLHYSTDDCKGTVKIVDFLASTNRELLYSRVFKKTLTFKVNFKYDKCYKRDVDMWVHFATQAANVEHFTLTLESGNASEYELPQFAYKNSSLKNLVLRYCQLNPCGIVSWTSLVSLSIGDVNLTDGVMENVLSACPNLECLELAKFSGIKRLEICSEKLRKLIIGRIIRREGIKNPDQLEIFAPYVQNLQHLGDDLEVFLQLKNVASLVTAALNFYLEFVDDYIEFDDAKYYNVLDKKCCYLKELLHSLVHVKNLELGPWCIEFLSILELRGWQSPASSRKSLTLNAALVQQDFPAICNLLQSSSDLETLVIDWTDDCPSRDSFSWFISEDENRKRFEKHVRDSSLLHLRTVKIINFRGPLSDEKFILPLVKHLLKNATVLEKMVIATNLRYKKFQGRDVSRDFVEMAEEFLSFPRSSKNAVVVFSHR